VFVHAYDCSGLVLKLVFSDCVIVAVLLLVDIITSFDSAAVCQCNSCFITIFLVWIKYATLHRYYILSLS